MRVTGRANENAHHGALSSLGITGISIHPQATGLDTHEPRGTPQHDNFTLTPTSTAAL